jgi:[citrate (pro-3S)-lyase] ligase
MGFFEIATVGNDVTLLEGGAGSIRRWCDELSTLEGKPPAACVVVNGNPLTNGHLHLLKTALENEGALYILVVSTDRSLFPADVRLSIIRQATKDWKNCVVQGAGEYIVSMATFPSYFTRKDKVARLQAVLDATVFARWIVPALNIKSRYVGEEPYCPVTSLYNQAMADVLPEYGIRFVQIDRMEKDREPVSASRVRDILRRGGTADDVADLVPAATVDFLKTPGGQRIIEKIRVSNTRH